MMHVQPKLDFPIRKKSTFYGAKENSPTQDFTNATLRLTPSTRYTPKVKKIVAISSSSESDSDFDVENTDSKNIKNTPRKRVNATRTPRRTRKISDSSEDEHGSTPPKQKKGGKQPMTPSGLLDRLNLEDLSGTAEKLTPKRLFPSAKYQNARRALHSSAPENLPGRESELSQLRTFLSEHLASESSGSLYVSGPPGTGKTACLSCIMREKEFSKHFQTIYVNCTSMKSASTIYSKIIQELGLPCTKSGRNSKSTIEKYLVKSHKMILLILDEIDQLESSRQSVLYSIFEWPSLANSKLILVGIANALDLTDRILPRLQARCELKPKLMHFAPYNKRQIADIITQRLSEANVSDVFTNTAVQLLAGKVAAISGDVRRALDISRRVIELSETEKMTQVLKPNVDNEMNSGSPKKQQPAVDRPVDLKEVVKVLNGVYGGSQNIDEDESTFPLQQKVLLCSLMLILNKGRNKDVTISKLHEVYTKVCRKRNIYAVDMSEFVSLCSLIETRGVVRLTTKKEPRLSKVNLQWDQEELAAALQDKQMMYGIMNDETCL
ncbi:cell division control protein 6 homolog [Venturia canescens]|uniref:cell division control protein 6 homolog n=1 Tax=Venturia canescens TaxID=32260 RepID=UPI001C9CE723|nr:cell division control protein 6 homolog [Venturia canescens]